MQKLLEDVKRTPVSIGFLKSRVPHGVQVLTYKQLNKPRAQIFKKKKPAIVLIPKKGESMGHFIALLPRERYIEYFSSLGGSPKSELGELGEPLQIMQKVLGKNFIYNRTQLQSGTYNIRDCASWVLARVKLADMNLRAFTKLFTRRTLQTSDDVVAIMTLLDFVNQ